ncbi:MalY/PatB family protein [Treponema primitia]|uniref:MalY/PatB family protein n=1 Tax=Treponema primitia TaxID=88058 RepID=UPI0002554F83|nr:aminotransferase class I/II-fold pyridoxal phosphate-dependent enzyme [Treponema primitia]
MNYNFDEPLNRRGFGSTKWDTTAGDVLPMFVADMDFKSAPAIIEAIQAKLDHGVFGYGRDQEFPGVIKKWFQDEYKVTIKEEWLTLLPAIVPVLAAVSRLREGRVLINTPNYHVLLAAPGKAGKGTILSPLKNTEEYYEIDFDDLANRIQDDVKLFYLCNPQNPVGRVYKYEELRELSRFAQERGLIVISDEAHCGLVYDRPHLPWFSVDEYAANQSITIMGPGKTYNMAGLPFGFAIIPNPVLREEFVKTCYALSNPGILNVAAAKAAYGSSREWHLQLVDYLKGNRDYLEKELKSISGVKFTHVEGTYLQWIDFRPLGIPNPYQWLQDKAKILPNNGKPFGLDGYVRINFGTTRARLEEAVKRIKDNLPKG